jgi:hypothetical protein
MDEVEQVFSLRLFQAPRICPRELKRAPRGALTGLVADDILHAVL